LLGAKEVTMIRDELVGLLLLAALLLLLASSGCGEQPTPTSVGQATPLPSREEQATATREPAATETPFEEPTPAATETREAWTQVVYDRDHTADDLLLDSGGDVDTETVSVGSPAEEARRSGNGEVLPSADRNNVEDYYMQFRVDDEFIYRGSPTPRVQIEVEYLDRGTDTFNVQSMPSAADLKGMVGSRIRVSSSRPIAENSGPLSSRCAMPTSAIVPTAVISASPTALMVPRLSGV
jgi:hypothetical protein